MRVLIIGAGGHAQVVADILLAMRAAGENIDVAGYLDDTPQRHGLQLLGRPVLGAVGDSDGIDHDGLIIAIGNNAVRRELFLRFQEKGARLIVARHPRATVAPDVTAGPGTMICAGAIVNTGATIGPNVILNTGCTVDHHNRIGAHTHIAPGAHLGGDVAVGEGTLIGIGAVVLPQTAIGNRVVVGGGALVRETVADDTMVAGVPARPIHARTRAS